MPGRKAHPAALMIVRNNDNRLTKDQIEGRIASEPKPKSFKLKTPDWMSDKAQQKWKRLVKHFKEMDAQILSDLDINALAIYCEAVITYRKLKQYVAYPSFFANSLLNLKDRPTYCYLRIINLF